MRILLITPPTTHLEKVGKPTLNIPIGLLSIAGMLEKEEYNVEIYDAKISGDVKHYKNYIHFGDSYETIKKKIKEKKPDVVGISNPFTAYIENAKEVARIVKKVDKNIKVIMGGPHASVAPKDFLKENTVDFVVMAEGEYTILKILRYLEGKDKIENIKNIAYKKGGKIKVNERGIFIQNLDDLSFPTYHLVDMEKYFKGYFASRPEFINRVVSMITSRGCPFNCIFCSIHLHMGRMWRANSPEYVLKHIKLLVDKYDVNLIHFEDDNLTFNAKRFDKILDGIIKSKLKIKWDTPNGVRADTLTKELLIKCKKSGCQYLIIGIESGNQKVLDEIVGKRLDLKKTIQVAKWCKEIDLDLEAFYVVGFPGETLDEIRDTFEFAKRLNERYDVYPNFNIATPLINTKLYDLCKKKGYFVKNISEKDFLTSRFKGVIKTKDFSPEDIENLFKEYGFFIKKARFKKALKHPFILKSYLIKLISGTRLYNLIKK